MCAIRFQTVRQCICVFHTNGTLMRPIALKRLWWSANEKGRGARWGPTPVFKKVFWETRGKIGKKEAWTEEAKDESRKRGERPAEIGVGVRRRFFGRR
ncbi:hypothetical protein TNCV_2707521 [Trichonephila clavipes]|nr:hypothetical protein TNCV_2707521 [Trichonephila clavipes]